MMIAATTIFLDPQWPAWRRTKRDVQFSEQHHCSTWRIGALVGYVALQLTIPLRHWVYPGDVAWTEEGHRLSWRMKLRSKHGWGYFEIVDADMNISRVDPARFLTPRQYQKALAEPDCILRFAHIIGRAVESETGVPVLVRAHIFASLNGRQGTRLVDPSVDLMTRNVGLSPKDWLTPSPRAIAPKTQ